LERPLLSDKLLNRSCPFSFYANEQQSALNAVASRAQECVVLKSWQRSGVGWNRLHQKHLSVAHQAPHRSFTNGRMVPKVREMIKRVP